MPDIYWFRLVSAGVGAVIAFWIYVQVVTSARLMRQHGINGEIALLYQIKRRLTFCLGSWLGLTSGSGVWPNPTKDRVVIILAIIMAIYVILRALRDRQALELKAALRLQEKLRRDDAVHSERDYPKELRDD